MPARPATSDEVRTLEREVLFSARALARDLSDIWGHVTCRHPGGDGFLLKHLRVPGRGVDPDEVMIFDYSGRRIEGSQADPWEIPLYTSVYAARPDVMSVIHVHPPVATALATTGRTIHAVTHEGLEFGDGLPVFAGDVVDTEELGQGMVAALGDAPACILKGHGAVLVGPTVPHVTVSAMYLERTAKQLVWASAVGVPEVLPAPIRDHITARRGGESPALWRYLQWLDETASGQ